MEPERIKIQLLLKPLNKYYIELEKQIYSDVLDFAMEKLIEADWQCGLFRNLYFSFASRVIENLKIYKLVDVDVRGFKDCDFNVELKQYETQIKGREIKYNEDYICGKCGSNKIHIEKNKIARSLDEGFTVMFMCENGHRWSSN